MIRSMKKRIEALEVRVKSGKRSVKLSGVGDELLALLEDCSVQFLEQWRDSYNQPREPTPEETATATAVGIPPAEFASTIDLAMALQIGVLLNRKGGERK